MTNVIYHENELFINLIRIAAGNSAGSRCKKKKDIAIQLYSVRDIINNGTDLNVVLKNLAQMGYTSIEAANYDNGKFYGKTPEEFKNAVEKAGMKVLSSHCSRGLSDKEVASGDFSESLNGGIKALPLIKQQA